MSAQNPTNEVPGGENGSAVPPPESVVSLEGSNFCWTSKKVLPPLTAAQSMKLLKVITSLSVELDRDELRSSLAVDEGHVDQSTTPALPPALLAGPVHSELQSATDNMLWSRPPQSRDVPTPEPAEPIVLPEKDEDQLGPLPRKSSVSRRPSFSERRMSKQHSMHSAHKLEEFLQFQRARKYGIEPRDYNPKSLSIFTVNNWVRIGCIKLSATPWFDRFILVVIFINSAFLAVFDPLDLPEVNPNSPTRDLLETASLVFTIIFFFEFIVKIIAYGLYFGKRAYLSDSWNWLDAGIVAISVLDFLPGGATSNLSAVRTFRVLRPLRAITRFQNLRFLVRLLLAAVPMLMNVVGLCFFIFFVFGILGVQLWQGTLRQRCYSEMTGEIHENSDFVCSILDSGFHKCSEGFECLALHQNPHYGVTHFDNIMGAILTIFQVMTYEGWTISMYLVQDGFSNFAIAYFVLLIFVGPIFAVQLFLVVISNEFARAKDKESTLEDMEFKAKGPVKKIMWYEKNPILNAGHAKFVVGRDKVSDVWQRKVSEPLAWVKDTKFYEGMTYVRGQVRRVATSKMVGNFIVMVIIVNTVFMAMEHDCDISCIGCYCKDFKLTLEVANILFTSIFAIEMVLKLFGLGLQEYFSDRYNSFDFIIVIISLVELPQVIGVVECLTSKEGIDARQCEGGASGLIVLRTFRLVRVLKLLRAFPALQRQIKVVVNTLSSVSALLVLISLALGIFAILGMNLFGGMWVPAEPSAVYLGSRVLIDIPGVDILRHAKVTNINGSHASGASYELELHWPLSDGTTTLWGTFEELSSGLAQPYPIIVGEVPRQNYDSFLLAVVTTFQILTQEDWQLIMYATSRLSGMWSSLYFVALIVLGNYMLLNLFIAIIIQGFADQPTSDDDDEDDEEDQAQKGPSRWQKVKMTVGMVFTRATAKISPLVPDFLKSEPATPNPAASPASHRGNPNSLAHKASFNMSTQGTPRTPQMTAIPMQPVTMYPTPVHAAAGTGGAPQPPSAPTTTEVNVNSDDRSTGSSVTQRKETEHGVVRGAPSRLSMGDDCPSDDEDTDRESAVNVSPPPEPHQTSAPLRRVDSDLSNTLTQREASPPQISPQPGGEQRNRVAIAPPLREETNGRPTPVAESANETDAVIEAAKVDAMQHRNIYIRGAERQQSEDGLSAAGSMAMSVYGSGMVGSPNPNSIGGLRGQDTVLKGMACFCLGRHNKIRLWMYRFVTHPKFDQFILLCILMSSVALAMQRPGIIGEERVFLIWLNLSLNIVFGVECISKVVALSFGIYIRSAWNQLDFFIVFTSVADFIFAQATGGDGGLQALRILRIFRIFRALRPLRVISRARGLKIVVLSITGSVKPILNTIFIAMMTFMIFGILGVQLFSGKLHYCSDPSFHTKEDCLSGLPSPLESLSSEARKRQWLNRKTNFDHIGEAMLAMFVIAAIDGWPIVMWNGVDSTGKRTGPEQNANLAIVLFFIITLLIAAFLVINIFVGVFVDNYNTASERVNASLKLRARTKKRKIVTLGQQQQEPNPDEAEQEHAPAHKLQWLMREIVTTTAFDLFIAACIALNVITMAFESYHQSAWQEQFLIISNFFFSYIFGLEAVMKLIAFQPKRYFKDGWNKFDYTIVLISFIGIAVETSGQTVALNPTILRVLRVFRIFRILRAFRIFKAAKGLQAIVDTLGKSLPAVANLFGMLCLLFFIYGILAVELFGSLCRTEDSGADGGHPARCKIIADEDLLDAHASFVNIGMALLTLFRIATGDGWADVMNACKLAAGPRLPGAMDKAKEAIAQEKWLEVWEALPGCQSATEMEELFGVDGCYGQELPCESTCGIEFAAPFFFASFLAIANFVLLNLVIAVLMQQLAASENAVQWTEDMVTPKLPRTTLARIYWRWRANARVYTLRMGLPLPQSNAGPTDYPSARRSGFRGPELLEPLGASGQGLVQRAVDAYAGTANPLTEVGANVTAPDGPTQFVAETQDEAGPLPRVNTATAFNMTAALQETEEDGPPAPAPQRQGSGHFVVAEEDLNLISRGSDAPSIPRPQPPTQPNPRPQPQPPAAPNTRPQPPAAPNTRPQRLRPGATAPAAPAPQTFVGRSTPPPYELKPVHGEANDQVVDWNGGEAQAKAADTET